MAVPNNSSIVDANWTPHTLFLILTIRQTVVMSLSNVAGSFNSIKYQAHSCKCRKIFVKLDLVKILII